MAIAPKPPTYQAESEDIQVRSGYYQTTHRYEPAPDPNILLSAARVIRIENGYLVKISMAEGEVAKQVFIKDLAELGDVLVAEIVARRIEK